MPKKSSPERKAWQSMFDRCRSVHDSNYRLYGARGITVCERWEALENFIQDMGLRPSDGHSLDRIDNDRGYEPGNCRWATAAQQARNQQRHRRPDVGVIFRKKEKKWHASLKVLGQKVHCGFFETQEEAISARKAAEQKYWVLNESPPRRAPSAAKKEGQP